MAKPSLAILDDYATIASQHFHHLLPNIAHLESLPLTLNTANLQDFESQVQRLQPFTIISSMRERTLLNAALLNRLPNLKLLLTTGTRNAAIDLDAARDNGVIVAGTRGGQPKNVETFPSEDLPPDAATGNFVNQHAWALLLGLCSRIPEDDYALKTASGAWQSGLGIPLGGKILGCVGLGKLGTLMAKTGVHGFGMKIVAWSENLTQEKADVAAEAWGLPRGNFKCVGKDELFRTADVVSLHLVLSDRTRKVVGKRELGLMKRSAIVVNTSRGGLIAEEALIEVLREGRIRGAALDVFTEEPLPADSPWRRSGDFKSEVVLSPHMGYVNAGTMHAWYEEQADVVQKWLSGEEVPNRMN